MARPTILEDPVYLTDAFPATAVDGEIVFSVIPTIAEHQRVLTFDKTIKGKANTPDYIFCGGFIHNPNCHFDNVTQELALEAAKQDRRQGHFVLPIPICPRKPRNAYEREAGVGYFRIPNIRISRRRGLVVAA
jgi:hypothetical protein